MSHLRVLTIASELPPVRSGVARSAGLLIDGLRDLGHHVDLISSDDARRVSLGEFRISGLAARWIRLQRLVAGYDVVQLYGPAPSIADVLLARWRCSRDSGLPSLVYTHNFTMELDGLRWASALYDRAMGRLYRAADAVVVTTPSYMDLLSPHAARVEVIPWANGSLSVASSAGNPAVSRDYDGSRPLRVLFVGQQRPYKGIGYLIDAVDGLQSVELTVIGGGTMLEHYQTLAQRSGNIRHLGPRTDREVSQAMADHDVLCLPSTNRSEAFGIVLLEAMAAGCALVASDLPGVNDVVGSAGVLVPPREVAPLRSALSGLAADPTLVNRLGGVALRQVEQYSWTGTVGAYEKLYHDLVVQSGTN